MESTPVLFALVTGLQLLLGGSWLMTAARSRSQAGGNRPETALAPWGFREKLRCAAEAATGVLLVFGFLPATAAGLGLILAGPRLLSEVRRMRQRDPLRHAPSGGAAPDGWGVAWAGLFLGAHLVLIGTHAWGNGGGAWLGRPHCPTWPEAALALALVAGATLCLRALEFLVRARAIARGRVAGQYMGI